MVLTVSESREIVEKIFHHIGCSVKDSKIISSVIISAEQRGIPSHGIIRIKDYLGLWQKGRLNPTPDIRIIYETPTTLVIDGDLGNGIVVAHFTMEKVIEKAQSVYTSWASVRNSNHFGIAGYYSMMAAEMKMIGISMTNANSLVAPTFSTDRMLGTNPIAVAIPTKNQPMFVADFATTPIARGKLELLEKMNLSVVELLVQDKDGNISTNPGVLKDGGAILPLGGDFEHGSHKGFCISAIIDIFSSVLSRANFGPFVPPQVAYLDPKPNSPGKGLGHFFGAMKIDAFQPAEEFMEYMDLWIETFRKAKTFKGVEQLVIPGDLERNFEALTLKNGIHYNDKVIEELHECLQNISFPSPF